MMPAHSCFKGGAEVLMLDFQVLLVHVSHCSGCLQVLRRLGLHGQMLPVLLCLPSKWRLPKAAAMLSLLACKVLLPQLLRQLQVWQRHTSSASKPRALQKAGTADHAAAVALTFHSPLC